MTSKTKAKFIGKLRSAAPFLVLAMIIGVAVTGVQLLASPNKPSHEITVGLVAPDADAVGNGENITYSVRGNTNDADATNLKVILTATNAVFDIMPSICKTENVDPISNISPDGATLTCNTGNWSRGSSFRIDVTARALGKNGDKAGVNASISSDNSDSSTVNGAQKTIRSVFKADIGIYMFDGSRYYPNYMLDKYGAPGTIVPIYWRTVVYNGSERVGQDGFTATITLDPSSVPYDDQKGFTGIVPIPASAGKSCTTVEDGDIASGITSGITLLGTAIGADAPKNFVANSKGLNDNANTDSGTCTATGQNGTYTLTVSGIDTSLRHIPTKSYDNTVLPKNEQQFASGVVWLWVPQTWLGVDAQGNHRGGGFKATISGYNPTSETQAPNAGEDSSNNTASTIIYREGQWSAGWDPWPFWNIEHFVAGQEISAQNSYWSGDQYNSNNKVTLCQIANGSSPGYSLSGPAYIELAFMEDINKGERIDIDRNLFTIQYSTQAVAPGGTPDCDDLTSALGEWKNYDTVKNDLAAVTKARVTFEQKFSFPMGIIYHVPYKISENAPVGTQLWTLGGECILSSSSLDCSMESPPHNVAEECFQGTPGKQYPCTNSYHDYAEVVAGKVSVSKRTVSESTTYSAGDEVEFKITALSLTGSQAGKIVLTDTLPAGMEYVPGSSSVEPTSTNGQVVVWTLNNVPHNTPQEVKYKVRIMSSAGTTSLTNSVVADLYDAATGKTLLDTRDSSERTDIQGISIASSAYVDIQKTVNKPQIDANDKIVFTLNAENRDAESHKFTDVIDILPFNGDERSPKSNYHGNLDKLTVESNQRDAKIYYTTADPKTISLNPHDSSNGAAGKVDGNTVNWTMTKPTANITAIRVIGGEWNLTDGDIKVALTIERNGWLNGDVFTDRFGMVADDTNLKMISNDVTTTIVDASLVPPGAPNTLSLMLSNPVVVLVAGLAVAGAVLVLLRHNMARR